MRGLIHDKETAARQARCHKLQCNSMAELVSLSDYPDQFQAEAIRLRLEAAGIQVIVTGTDAATALSMGGAGTDRLVRVEVAESDYEQAKKLLIEDEKRLESASAWICSRCDEQNEPAFEVCWGCNKTQSEKDKLGRRDEKKKSEDAPLGEDTSVTSQRQLGTTDDSNPFRPVLIGRSSQQYARTTNDNQVVPTEEQEESVRRAFLASVAALLLLPPLVSFYSVYILCGLGTQAFKYPPFRPRLIAAWGINLIVICFATVFWVGLFRP